MALQVEGTHPGEWLLSEANGSLSRDAAVLVSGQNLLDGAVLGKISSSGKYKEMDPAAVDGSQTAAAILLGDKDASAADQNILIVNASAEIMKSLLKWKSGITDNQKTTAYAQLAVNLVKARDSRI
jgi:hypothetical protein